MENINKEIMKNKEDQEEKTIYLRMGKVLNFVEKIILVDGTVIENVLMESNAEIPEPSLIMHRIKQPDETCRFKEICPEEHTYSGIIRNNEKHIEQVMMKRTPIGHIAALTYQEKDLKILVSFFTNKVEEEIKIKNISIDTHDIENDIKKIIKNIKNKAEKQMEDEMNQAFINFRYK